MKLKSVEKLISVLNSAEKFRKKPNEDIGSCVICDGIYLRSGSIEILVVSAKYYQGDISKRFEVIDMLPYIQKNLPEYGFYYLQGILD